MAEFPEMSSLNYFRVIFSVNSFRGHFLENKMGNFRWFFVVRAIILSSKCGKLCGRPSATIDSGIGLAVRWFDPGKTARVITFN